MMIELGKAKVFKRQITQLSSASATPVRPSRTSSAATRSQWIHQRLSLSVVASVAAAKARMASCITCFSGTECRAAKLRQSSYSGDALAIFARGQRAILMRTRPRAVSTSTNSRLSDRLFSTLQCNPIVVVRGRSLPGAAAQDRDGTARSTAHRCALLHLHSYAKHVHAPASSSNSLT